MNKQSKICGQIFALAISVHDCMEILDGQDVSTVELKDIEQLFIGWRRTEMMEALISIGREGIQTPTPCHLEELMRVVELSTETPKCTQSHFVTMRKYLKPHNEVAGPPLERASSALDELICLCFPVSAINLA